MALNGFSFGKGKSGKLQKGDEGEESASAVRKTYETRIDRFLRDVDAPKNLLGQRGKTLDEVFEWGRKIVSDKRKVDRQLDEYVQAYQTSQNQVDQLTRRLAETQTRLQQRESQLQQARSTIQQMGHEKNAILAQHDRESRRMKEKYEGEKRRTQEKHEDQVTRMTMDHSKTVQNLEDEHRDTVEQLNQEIQKLIGQLLVDRSDNEGWPDDKLKFTFNKLRQLIDNTTSPTNKDFIIPEGRADRSRLDPTNFLGRQGTSNLYFLLRSSIWKILQEQFFSTPFGLGAFGTGKGHAKLMNVYLTWRGLFEGSNQTSSTDDEAIALLRQDKMANTWRTATFQSINEALVAANEKYSHSRSPIVQLSVENSQLVVERIRALFLEVAKLSNSRIQRDLEDEIHEMVNIASQLAVQFGVHPAQLRICSPGHGERIQIGPDFHDCQNGDDERGAMFSVELVVVPGLQKIGDGRSDMTSRRSIVPCEIYPVEA